MARVTRRLPRPNAFPAALLARAAVFGLAIAIVLAAVPVAIGPAHGATPVGDPGLTADEMLLAFAAPVPTPQPSGGAARWLGAVPNAAAKPGLRTRRMRPGRRPPAVRGRAQRWYARRLLDGG